MTTETPLTTQAPAPTATTTTVATPAAPALAEAPEFAKGVSLEPEVADWLSKSGAKDWAGVASVAYSTKKLVGHDPSNIIVRPKEGDSQALRAVMRNLGAPEKGADYGFKVPEGGDPKFAEWAGNTLAEIGIPKAQAAALFEAWNAYAAERSGALTAASDEKRASDFTAFKAKMGDGFGRVAAEAQAAMREAELTPEEGLAMESILGVERATTIMAKLGKHFVEAAFKGGEGGGSGFDVSPERAQAELDMLRSDKAFIERWNKGDVDARKKVQQLTAIIANAMPTMATANATPMAAGASAPIGGRVAAM